MNTNTKDWQVQELIRQYDSAKSLRCWTLWAGLFCLWPIWGVSLYAHIQMNNILHQAAMLGVHPASISGDGGCTESPFQWGLALVFVAIICAMLLVATLVDTYTSGVLQ